MGINRIDLEQILPALGNGSQIIVPSLRIKDAILSQILDSTEHGVIPSPLIKPIDVYIKNRWIEFAKLGIAPCNNQQILESHEENILWIKVIESSLEETPLLNPEETANEVSQSYRLAQQWIEMEVFAEELRKKTGIPDIDVFARWVKSFNQICKEENYISLVDATHELITLIEDQVSLADKKQTLLVNFYKPPPLYQKFFNSFENASSCLTVNPKEKLKQLAKAKYEFIDQSTEIQYCAKWVKEIATKEPDAHIGIISCNPATIRNELEQALSVNSDANQLFNDSTQNTYFNSTGNFSNLNETALVYDGLLILALGNDFHNINDLIRVLQSPFLTPQENSENENNFIAANIALARYLYFMGKPSISARELSSIVNNAESAGFHPELASRLLFLRTKLRSMHNLSSPLQWQEAFVEILTEFGWPGKLRLANEERIFKQWQLLLSNFSLLSTIHPALSYSEALRTLRTLATRTTQYSHFNPSLTVSLFDPSDAIGFEYDYLWLLGFSDQQWPEPANPSPFIAYSLQKSAKLPGSHSDIQLSNAMTQFKLLLASTRKQVHASFHRNNAEQEFCASGFLRDFKSGAILSSADKLSQCESAELGAANFETIFDHRHSLTDDEIVEGGSTLINDQSSCPFRAFAHNRLHVSGEPNIEPGLSKAARGNAIHNALENFYRNTKSSQELIELSDEELAIRIETAVSEAIERLSIYNREIMTPRMQSIEFGRILKLISSFLEAEKSRPAFKVIAREKRLSRDFGNLRLNLRIDRIDELIGNESALIDYKTGKYTTHPKNWINERSEDLQLPVYHVIANDAGFNPVKAVAIAHLNAEKIGFTGAAATANFSSDIRPIEKEKWTDLSWQQISEFWKDSVDSLAADFQKGVCDVNPVDPATTCTYCGLQPLCRIQEITACKQDKREGEQK